MASDEKWPKMRPQGQVPADVPLKRGSNPHRLSPNYFYTSNGHHRAKKTLAHGKKEPLCVAIDEKWPKMPPRGQVPADVPLKRGSNHHRLSPNYFYTSSGYDWDRIKLWHIKKNHHKLSRNYFYTSIGHHRAKKNLGTWKKRATLWGN